MAHQLENEFRAIMPCILPARQDICPVQGVQIEHVESAGVVQVCSFVCHLVEQLRVPPRHKEPKALLQVRDRGAFRMHGDACSISPADALLESIGRPCSDLRVCNQFVPDSQRCAVSQLEPRHGRHVTRILIDSEESVSGFHSFCQMEFPVRVQIRGRYGSNPRCVFGYEERIGVQSRGNTRPMHGIHHGFEAFPATRINLPVDLTIPPAKRLAPVQVYLGRPHGLCGAYPVSDICLRHIFIGRDEIGSPVDFGIQGPRTAQGRTHQFRGGFHRNFQRFAHLRWRTSDNSAPRPLKTKMVIRDKTTQVRT